MYKKPKTFDKKAVFDAFLLKMQSYIIRLIFKLVSGFGTISRIRFQKTPIFLFLCISSDQLFEYPFLNYLISPQSLPACEKTAYFLKTVSVTSFSTGSRLLR